MPSRALLLLLTAAASLALADTSRAFSLDILSAPSGVPICNSPATTSFYLPVYGNLKSIKSEAVSNTHKPTPMMIAAQVDPKDPCHYLLITCLAGASKEITFTITKLTESQHSISL